MKYASVTLLKKALKALKQYYFLRANLEPHIARFRTLVEKSSTMTEQEKKIMQEEIRVNYSYDWFIDNNPDIIDRMKLREREGFEKGIEKGNEEGFEKGIEKGIVEGLQMSVIGIIQAKFPDIIQQVRSHVLEVQDATLLSRLNIQIVNASDSASVLALLQEPRALGA
jgi:flagellar biosynthesis/type III secretory pathway protein FliH